jgi:hypothetical protein
MILSACGSSDPSQAHSDQVGSDVESSFLQTIDAVPGVQGWTAQLGSSCKDQNTGVSLGQTDDTDLTGEPTMLFHCSVDLLTAPNGQLGLLYYLTVHKSGQWSASQEYTPLYLQYDTIDSCAGIGCNDVMVVSPDKLAGNRVRGRVVGPDASENSSSTTGAITPSSPAGTDATTTTLATASESTSSSTTPSSAGTSQVRDCGSIQDSEGGRWRTYVLNDSSCSSVNDVLNAVVNHHAQLHNGSDQAHTYSSYQGWRCPAGQMGNQVCDFPTSTPYQDAALAIDCTIAQGGCPIQIPASYLDYGIK